MAHHVHHDATPTMKWMRAVSVVLMLGCSWGDEPIDIEALMPSTATRPARLCRTKALLERCRTAEEVESWLTHPDLEIIGWTATPSGLQGAKVLTLRAPGMLPVVFRAKWRASSTTSARNSPRRELAAYAVQKLFLEPHEYVVPPTAPHCFPIDEYRKKINPRAKPTWRDVPCVYGILSYWLEDVEDLG